jgi:hypothetical protein
MVIDIFIFGTLFLLIFMVIGIFAISKKASEIISRLEFQAEQNKKVINLLSEVKEQQANKK